jgi:hypothetical protein
MIIILSLGFVYQTKLFFKIINNLNLTNSNLTFFMFHQFLISLFYLLHSILDKLL